MKHPDTQTSLDELASVPLARREDEAPKKLRQRDMEGREQVLGIEHPSTLGSVYNLAYLFHSKAPSDAASGLLSKGHSRESKGARVPPPYQPCMLEEVNEKEPSD